MGDFEKTGDWDEARRIFSGLEKRVAGAFRKSVLAEAHFLRKEILKAFAAGGPEGAPWAPHSPITLAVRQLLGNRKSKLLIQSSDLRDSIGVVPYGEGVFVGVKRSAASASKLGAVNLAAIHEEGRDFVVHMTEKQRRLLFAAMRAAGMERTRARGKAPPGGHEIHIRIPPRPFLGPIFSAFATPDQLERSIVARMAILLGGDLGQPEGAPRE